MTAPPLERRIQPAANGPQWLDHPFSRGDQSHRYRLYVPSVYQGQPLPMIVMLHGAQQDPEDIAAGTEMNEAAEAHGYIVAYPEQSENTNLLKCWHWFRAGDQSRETGETSMIAALTREVVSDYNADPSRVFVAGMSAGGAMAVNLAVPRENGLSVGEQWLVHGLGHAWPGGTHKGHTPIRADRAQ
ncbi:alpha/beta hydrolase family esterase [Caballeronia zhejiangensis]|uniref:extracellular catalytic domain type 1 short-chain-length polyhydroxyalkanoate depolymerase n=1 Tax=Caballeronia zhejiangensis TaxID=871203 RepID=UPI00094EF05C